MAGAGLSRRLARAGRSSPYPPLPAGTEHEYFETTEYQDGELRIRVAIPDNYSPFTPLPVIYVLPVEALDGETFGSGYDTAMAADVCNTYGAIVVYPEMAITPWWGDHATDPDVRQESFLTDFLVPFIEARYATPQTPEGRGLISFSKGGWGAFALIFRRPDVWGFAASWDAPYDLNVFFGFTPEVPDVFGTSGQCDLYRPNLIAAGAAADFTATARLVVTGSSAFGASTTTMQSILSSNSMLHVFDNTLSTSHAWGAAWFDSTMAHLARIMGLGPSLVLELPALAGTIRGRWRADGYSTSTGTCTDIGGEGNHLLQATGANRPTLTTANGRAAMGFDGARWVRSATFVGGASTLPTTVFIVQNKSGALGANRILCDGRISTNRNVIWWPSTNVWRMLGITDVTMTGGDAADPSVGAIAATFNGASSVGLFDDWDTDLCAGNPGTHVLEGFTLGAGYNNTSPWIGTVNEVIVVEGATTDDVLAVRAYFRDYYGLGFLA